MTIAPERQTTRELSDYERALLDILEERLADHNLEALGPVDAIADRMLASLPDAGSAWAESVGPVFTSRALQDWLGISRQALNQHVQARRILRLITADNVSVFPGFQFNDNGQRLPHLKAVLDALAQGIDDPWTWATWLNSRVRGGLTNAELLRTEAWQDVLNEAMEDAAAWGRP